MNETNRKTSPLAALLAEDPVDTTSQICNDIECGNFALQDSGYCATHSDKRPLDVPGLGEDAEAKAILKAQNLCTRCNMRPFVYGNEKDGMCEPCAAIARTTYSTANKQTQQTTRLLNSPKLNSRQKALLKKRAPKQQEICEENWGGPCGSIGGDGCGKMIHGQFYCNDCKKKKAEKNFTLSPGEVELVRHNVGKTEDKIVKQLVVKDAASIEMEEMLWLWPNRIPEGAITWIMGQPNNAKSLLTIEIAACATTGRDWPDGTPNTMGKSKVLMYCGEDSLSKVVIPRLTTAGADLAPGMIGFLDRKSFRTVAGTTVQRNVRWI